uniref:HEAT repeat-containing protein 1 n=1 Tax=Labrus bergylta TaxID=56723 RepID=A0A3Q3LZS5_9LABR
MTSLAHQLKRLALPQSDPKPADSQRVASLLFDPKDAASMDKELLELNQPFWSFRTPFQPSVADPGAQRPIQRVNEKLDAGISLFLTRLSPYFLLKPLTSRCSPAAQVRTRLDIL